MNSTTLLNKGFAELPNFILHEFGTSEHKEKLAGTGLYVFVIGKEFPRLFGMTDILYIGQSGGNKNGRGRFIFERIKEYSKPQKGAPDDYKKNNSLTQIQEKFGVKLRLLYKFEAAEECRVREKDLLEDFRVEHLDRPPLNKQS